MKTTLAFDIYGTLIDTRGVLDELHRLVGDQAPAFSQLWRDKQLEYSFRRGLMKRYDDFAVCTAQALNYCCQVFNTPLSDAGQQQLLAGYQHLPAFADVRQALDRLHAAGYPLVAFSNGSRQTVDALLQQAGLGDLFSDIVSVEEIQSFKPDPDVYYHLLRRIGQPCHTTWLVSGNPFDIIGARNAGLQAAWLKRDDQAVFDPWELEPTATVAGLGELPALLENLDKMRQIG